MQTKNRVAVEIRVNKDKAEMELYIDRKLVRSGATQRLRRDRLRHLFFSQLNGPIVRVSNLRVSAGRPLRPGSIRTGLEQEDMVYLKNRDEVPGNQVDGRQKRDHQLAGRRPEHPAGSHHTRVPDQAGGQAEANRPWEVRAHFAGGAAVSFNLNHGRAVCSPGEAEILALCRSTPSSFVACNSTSARHRKQTTPTPAARTNFGHGMTEATSKLVVRSALGQAHLACAGAWPSGGQRRPSPRSISPTAIGCAAVSPPMTSRWCVVGASDAGGMMQFNISRVTELTSTAMLPDALPPGNLCEVMLVNGDHFRGNLTGTTEQHYLLDTWHAGKLQLARKSVRKIARCLGG